MDELAAFVYLYMVTTESIALLSKWKLDIEPYDIQQDCLDPMLMITQEFLDEIAHCRNNDTNKDSSFNWNAIFETDTTLKSIESKMEPLWRPIGGSFEAVMKTVRWRP